MSESVEKELKRAITSIDRLLMYRLRSRSELIDKLTTKGFKEDVIEAALSYFEKLNMIDDSVFARAWITSRLKKPFGKNRIRQELMIKGVSKDIIKQELDSAMETNYEELEVIRELAEHRLSKYKNIDEDKKKQRLIGYLQRRGFNTSEIIKVVREL